MGIWLGGWAGDHSGPIDGRQPNRLLLSLTTTDASSPSGLFHRASLYGHSWYPDLYTRCLTPSTRLAIATAVDSVADYIWSVELAEVDWGDGRGPWKPGVHLFSVMLMAPIGHQFSVILTALVTDKVHRIDLREVPPGVPPWYQQGPQQGPRRP